MDNKNLFFDLEKMWVLILTVRARTPMPYCTLNGRAEFFTNEETAKHYATEMEQREHAGIRIYALDGQQAIHAYIRLCMHNGMEFFHMDSGSDQAREFCLSELFAYRERNLPEEKNRIVRFCLLRAGQYAARRLRFPEEDRDSADCLAVTEMELTMLYNAYREMYRGILYALAVPIAGKDQLDYYTPQALERANQWLAEKKQSVSAYTAASLIHGDNQGGMLYTQPLKLMYANQKDGPKTIENGMVCAYTTYEAALSGKAFFETANYDCAVVAVTGPELMLQAEQCAGMLIDMETLNYQISKTRFGEWITYGKLDAPIVVHLKPSKDNGSREDKPDQTPPMGNMKEENSL